MAVQQIPLSAINQIAHADSQEYLGRLPEASVDLSFWSPPYCVGKSYERDLTFEGWCALVSNIILEHSNIIKPGGFMVVNIGDILCFPDDAIPSFQADNIRGKKVAVSREDILAMLAIHPGANRYQLAELLGCSE